MIVYVALGERRLKAAQQYLQDGPATLIVGPRTEITVPSGVRVLRYAPGTKAEIHRILLRDATLVIAGDPDATPLTWWVARRRPELPVRFEMPDEPLRHPAPADLAVVTPWYPAPDDPFAGAFVEASTAAVRDDFPRVSVLHTQSWFYSPVGVRGQLVAAASARQARRSGTTVVQDTPVGELTRVVVPTASGDTYPQYAEAQVNALRAALPTGRIEAPLVHAHTGMLGGVVATRLARPDARVVVTEHASFLAKVLAQPDGRRQYTEMLARVDAMLCVSRHLYDQLSTYFPAYVDKLRVVPNAIDFDRFAVRPAPPRSPRRWLYVGRLMANKGVLTLLEAFALVAADDPDVTLTMVGAGVLAEELAKRVAELGLGDRVALLPPVPPERIGPLMHEHDLLVHASLLETFGMTVVEAVATGTPVLVARSQGPSETLSGLDSQVGGLFEPTGDPAVIVAAFEELRARFDTLDLPSARAALLDRYGSAAVAAQLREVYAAPRPSRGPVPGGVSLGSPFGHRLTGALPSPLPDALLHRWQRIRRRLVRSVRQP